MQRIHQATTKKMVSLPRTFAVETTLYDLFEAVYEEVQPAEDQLVPFIVKDILNTGSSDLWLQ